MNIPSLVQRAPLTWLITGLALLLFAVPSWGKWFEFQFYNFDGWQWLSLLGCHCLHWSGEHLFWDLSMFFILGLLCESHMQRKFAAVMALAGLAIPLCVLTLQPQLHSYRGLSGLDTAIFSLFMGHLLVTRLRERDWTQAIWMALLLVGMVLKIGAEVYSSANIFVSDDSFTPVPLAHVIGAVIGLAVCSFQFINHSTQFLLLPQYQRAAQASGSSTNAV